MSASPLRLEDGDVRSWHAHIDVLADGARAARALTWLDPGERARHDRYHHDDDRRMFLLGRVMARALVGHALGLGPTDWRWREGPHGRPEIAAPETRVRFNLAHSAGLVVCALAAHRDVGIDVEDLARRPLQSTIVRRYCSDAEVADVEARPREQQQDRFLTYWTLKEAYLKARGLGIAVPLADVSFTIDAGGARVGFLRTLEGTDTRWAFHVTQPTARHVMAIAVSTAGGARPIFAVEPFPVPLF